MPAKKTPKYIRNIRAVQVGVRLGTGRRIDLKPRGQRGDCAPVTEEEMTDEIFLGNVHLLFEVIPAAEAEQVIAKQTTNQQMIHPALAVMRNELGEEYKNGVVVVEESEQERPVVAAVNDRGMITRFKAPGSVDKPLPNIPNDIAPEQVTDWVARQKNVEGPEAGLAGLKVTKTPVQKS